MHWIHLKKWMRNFCGKFLWAEEHMTSNAIYLSTCLMVGYHLPAAKEKQRGKNNNDCLLCIARKHIQNEVIVYQLQKEKIIPKGKSTIVLPELSDKKVTIMEPPNNNDSTGCNCKWIIFVKELIDFLDSFDGIGQFCNSDVVDDSSFTNLCKSCGEFFNRSKFPRCSSNSLSVDESFLRLAGFCLFHMKNHLEQLVANSSETVQTCLKCTNEHTVYHTLYRCSGGIRKGRESSAQTSNVGSRRTRSEGGEVAIRDGGDSSSHAVRCGDPVGLLAHNLAIDLISVYNESLEKEDEASSLVSLIDDEEKYQIFIKKVVEHHLSRRQRTSSSILALPPVQVKDAHASSCYRMNEPKVQVMDLAKQLYSTIQSSQNSGDCCSASTSQSNDMQSDADAMESGTMKKGPRSTKISDYFMPLNPNAKERVPSLNTSENKDHADRSITPFECEKESVMKSVEPFLVTTHEQNNETKQVDNTSEQLSGFSFPGITFISSRPSKKSAEKSSSTVSVMHANGEGPSATNKTAEPLLPKDADEKSINSQVNADVCDGTSSDEESDGVFVATKNRPQIVLRLSKEKQARALRMLKNGKADELTLISSHYVNPITPNSTNCPKAIEEELERSSMMERMRACAFLYCTGLKRAVSPVRVNEKQQELENLQRRVQCVAVQQAKCKQLIRHLEGTVIEAGKTLNKVMKAHTDEKVLEMKKAEYKRCQEELQTAKYRQHALQIERFKAQEDHDEKWEAFKGKKPSMHMAAPMDETLKENMKLLQRVYRAQSMAQPWLKSKTERPIGKSGFKLKVRIREKRIKKVIDHVDSVCVYPSPTSTPQNQSNSTRPVPYDIHTKKRRKTATEAKQDVFDGFKTPQAIASQHSGRNSLTHKRRSRRSNGSTVVEADKRTCKVQLAENDQSQNFQPSCSSTKIIQQSISPLPASAPSQSLPGWVSDYTDCLLKVSKEVTGEEFSGNKSVGEFHLACKVEPTVDMFATVTNYDDMETTVRHNRDRGVSKFSEALKEKILKKLVLFKELQELSMIAQYFQNSDVVPKGAAVAPSANIDDEAQFSADVASLMITNQSDETATTIKQPIAPNHQTTTSVTTHSTVSATNFDEKNN